MENVLLINITMIFAVSIPVLYVFLRLRLPSILGFLITGLLLGPYGLGLINTVNEVEILAEIGVVLLLFTIGIEFSLSNLQKIRRSVLVAGTFQVGVTVAAVYLLGLVFGFSPQKAIFFGFLAVLSSTAIVFKLLQERAELSSPHGMTSAAILIFQDLMVVPFILVVPYLSDSAGNAGGESIALTMLKAVALVGIMIVSAKWIIPKILYFTVKTRSRELFLLLITVICLATAWLTHAAGLSPALGAFMAGLIISESEYSHEAIGNIIPFKDAFTGLFFVSVGMLVDVRIMAHYPVLIPCIILGVLLIKSFIAGAAVLVLGYPARTALFTGLYLAQVGEFTFIIAKLGMEAQIIANVEYQIFLIVVVVTMGLTPFIMIGAPHIVKVLLKIPFIRVPGRSSLSSRTELKKMDGHLIIVGYGINGKNVARAARYAGIDYIIIEMNADTVKREKEAGENIFFGDATHDAVLEHAGINTARVMVVAIADHAATLRITKAARGISRNLYIIIRTRFFQDVKTIYGLGADEVIPEEYETSIEIFSRVLSKYLVPRQNIEKLVSEVRSEGYEMFRSLSLGKDGQVSLNVDIPDLEISRLAVSPGSPLDGKTLLDINLRLNYGITVIAIDREGGIIANPGGDVRLCSGDMLIVMGNRSRVSGMYHLFNSDSGSTAGRE